MLSARWIIPAGGLLLAMAFLTLAIDLSKESLWRTATVRPAINIALNDDRAEWREFISLVAARRRADELNRLHELPTEPVRIDDELAAPSADPRHSRISDETNYEAPLNVRPITAVPVDIDGSLSIEFPMAGHPIEDDDFLSIEFPVSAAVETKRQTIKTPRHTRAPNVRRQAHLLASRQQTRGQDFFEFPFGGPTLAANPNVIHRPAEQVAPTFTNNN